MCFIGFMVVSNVKSVPNHRSDNKQKFASKFKPAHTKNNETILLAGAIAATAGGIQYVGNRINRQLDAPSMETLKKSAILSTLVAGSLYGTYNFLVPMWSEVTEYRHERVPFITSSTYYNPKTKMLERFKKNASPKESSSFNGYATSLVAIVAGSLYGIYSCLDDAYNYLAPMWDDVSETYHKHDPLTTASTYNNPNTKMPEQFKENLPSNEYATSLY